MKKFLKKLSLLIKEIFKRLDSLLWLVGMQGLAFGLDAIAANLGILNLDPMWVSFIGLILAQVSKSVRKAIEGISVQEGE